MLDFFYLSIIAAAIFPIYMASHAALARPKNAIPSQVGQQDGKEQTLSSVFDTRLVENLAFSDVLMFPVACGAALLSLYLILTYTSVDLNFLLLVYTSLMSLLATGKIFQDTLGILKDFFFPNQWRSKHATWYTKGGTVFQSTATGEADIKVEDAVPLPYGNIIGPLMPAGLRTLIRQTREGLFKTSKIKISVDERADSTWCFTHETETSAAYCLAVILAIAYYLSPEGNKSWALNNVLGTAFAYNGIQMINSTSFPISFTLLWLLFIYDIFFVFYTEVMVSVASNLVDVPIKLVIPRTQTSESGTRESFAMLGLGDIVLPGIVISLALRYDLWRWYEYKKLDQLAMATEGEKAVAVGATSTTPTKNLSGLSYENATGSWGTRFWMKDFTSLSGNSALNWNHGGQFPKPYFYSGLLGYICGLIICVFAMQCAKQAQPALLYLVPCLQLALVSCAIWKGELRWMLTWTESDDKNGLEHQLPDIRSDKEASREEISSGKASLVSEKKATNVLAAISEAWKLQVAKNQDNQNPVSLSLKTVLSLSDSEDKMPPALGNIGAKVSSNHEVLYQLLLELGKRQQDDSSLSRELLEVLIVEN